MDKLTTDVCVVGGGMAGLAAAVTASRQGARVVLVQDRPVLGGNVSSEVRIHITGADPRQVREAHAAEVQQRLQGGAEGAADFE